MTAGQPGRPRRWRLPAQEEDPDRRGLFRPNRRFMLGMLLALILLAGGRALLGGGGGGAHLATSCTRPALALREGSVPAGGQVTFAITGPAADAYTVYLDVTAVSVRPDGSRQVTTRGGVPPTSAEVLLSVPRLTGCRAEGTQVLNGSVGRGEHTVTLFRVAPDGSATALASQPLTVS